MKPLWAAVLSLGILAPIGCGGGGGGSSPTPTRTPPTSGEFLFEGNSGQSLNGAQINTSNGMPDTPTLLGARANDDVIYPGVALAPSKQFLYSLWTSFSAVTVFQVSGPGLQLREIPNSPFFLSEGVNSMVLHPNGEFLYVVQSPATIQELKPNSTTGDLTPGSTLTAMADFRVAIIDPTGKFLYVTDLTGGRIFAYQISPGDGSLAAVAGQPFTISASSEPSIPVIDRTGHFLYVSLISGIAAFAIDGSTGALTAVSGSPFPTSSEPVFMAVDPQADFMYACMASTGAIDGFSINTSSGVLTSVGGSVTTAPAVSNIIVDPSGKFVYVSVESGSSIYGFSLDSSTGTLSPLSGSPFAAVSNPTNLFIASF